MHHGYREKGGLSAAQLLTIRRYLAHPDRNHEYCRLWSIMKKGSFGSSQCNLVVFPEKVDLGMFIAAVVGV